MKKIIILFAFFAIALNVITSCQKKQCNEEQTVCEDPIVVPYQPSHIREIIDLKELNNYTYFNAPLGEPAISVNVKYDTKHPYTAPIIITYTFKLGNTYTYVIPKEFGLRTNEMGRFKIIQDEHFTVWMQGQTTNGKFYEIVLYGNEKFNGVKIKPNSHYNHPHGVIKYCN